MRQARDTATAARPLGAQSDGSPDQTSLLTMRGIVKRYGATTALNSVDLTVRAGEIHALLGENGAAKSTLMHVLSGLTTPDSGEIRLDGQAVRIGTPRTARTHGIAMVHQHFTLVPAFTVAENLALDTPKNSGSGVFSARQSARTALERAESLGWKLDPDASVSSLSVGTQQRVEIVKALATEARLLIFDEPTAVLAGDEVEELFGVLRRLRDEGRAVILIAHKLAEILAVADTVTVLRRGNLVASCPVAETDAPRLAAWMIGTSDLPESQPTIKTVAAPATKTDEVQTADFAFTAKEIVVKGDQGEDAIRGLSLEVRRGEIFGIGGVDGNGQTELAEALIGLRAPKSGMIRWNGGEFKAGISPTVGYIPQDRRRIGLAVTMSIEENLLYDAVRDPKFRRGPFLRQKALRQLARDLIREFDIRTTNALLPASALSGGNQQKIVVARALHFGPEWIVAVNPTRGLDIGATRFVHEQLRLARGRGAAVVLISTDLDELAALSDRAAILSSGRLTEYRASEADPTQIGLLLGGLGTAPPTAARAAE